MLTTHVLDTAHGQPGQGIRVRLYALEGSPRLLTDTVTNADGRCDAPIIARGEMAPGRYRLTFGAGAYFRARGVTLADPAFLDEVVIEFGIAEADAHYHVPLLISPYGYSTYRGS